MYEFIRDQYRTGCFTEAEVRSFCPVWITEAEAGEIIKSKEGMK